MYESEREEKKSQPTNKRKSFATMLSQNVPCLLCEWSSSGPTQQHKTEREKKKMEKFKE